MRQLPRIAVVHNPAWVAKTSMLHHIVCVAGPCSQLQALGSGLHLAQSTSLPGEAGRSLKHAALRTSLDVSGTALGRTAAMPPASRSSQPLPCTGLWRPPRDSALAARRPRGWSPLCRPCICCTARRLEGRSSQTVQEQDGRHGELLCGAPSEEHAFAQGRRLALSFSASYACVQSA